MHTDLKSIIVTICVLFGHLKVLHNVNISDYNSQLLVFRTLERALKSQLTTL